MEKISAHLRTCVYQLGFTVYMHYTCTRVPAIHYYVCIQIKNIPRRISIILRCNSCPFEMCPYNVRTSRNIFVKIKKKLL